MADEYQNENLMIGEMNFETCDFGLYLNALKNAKAQNYSKVDYVRKAHEPTRSTKSKVAPIDAKKDKNKEIASILHDITVNIHPQEKICIVGHSKSGKSTFLLSIIDETELANGKFTLNGSVSMLSRENFVLEGTIRDNILFGRSMNSDLYTECLMTCELDKEFLDLESNEFTYIDDKSTHISEILKKKLCLARFLYKNSDIILIDGWFDDLGHYYKRKLFTAVMLHCKDKTVLYASEDIDLARMSSRIFLFNYGLLDEIGTFFELSTKPKSAFYNLMCMDVLAQQKAKLLLNNPGLDNDDISVEDWEHNDGPAKHNLKHKKRKDNSESTGKKINYSAIWKQYFCAKGATSVLQLTVTLIIFFLTQ